jgi:hypothetical protein
LMFSKFLNTCPACTAIKRQLLNTTLRSAYHKGFKQN